MDKYIFSVITGDVINSGNADPADWLESLRNILNDYGEEPCDWEIYRGDSFQLQLDPEEGMSACLHLKAVIRQFEGLDVRMAIGLGNVSYQSEKVTQSHGTAFERSGECFDALKKKSMAIKSGDHELDVQINLLLEIALLTIDRWSPTESGVIEHMIRFPDKTQKSIAHLLNKSESTISETLTRAGYDEIMKMEGRYRQLIGERYL